MGCGLIDSDGKDVSAVKVEDSNEAAEKKKLNKQTNK